MNVGNFYINPTGLVREGRSSSGCLSEGSGQGYGPCSLVPFYLISGGRVNLTLMSNSPA